MISWEKNGKTRKFLLSCYKNMLPGDPALSKSAAGGGKITAKAVVFFDQIHASDVSRRMLQLSQKALGKNGKIQFHQIDGFTLKEFADNSIDLVYSHDVFVHFSSLQVYPYLREIKRVLKPNGIMIISFYNFVHHFGLFKEMALEYHNDRRFPPHMRVHFITEEMALTMLKDLELRPVEINKENFLIVAAEK